MKEMTEIEREREEGGRREEGGKEEGGREGEGERERAREQCPWSLSY